MLKKYTLPGGIIALGFALIVVLVVAKPKPEPGPVPEEPAKVKVTVTPSKQQNLRLLVNAHGSVLPKREIDLVAQVAGQIVNVEAAFVDGGFFAKDQLLIEIDEREYQAALLSAKARLAEAEKLLAEEQGRSRQAKKEWRDLGNENANDLFLRKPQLAAAQANLDSARGEVDRAQHNLERTRIVVPFDGRIKQTYADLGQFVSIGSRLATVYDSTIVEVRLPLTEKQAALIDLPLSAKQIEQIFTPVTIRGSVAGEDHEWQGVLARTDAFVDADSRMYYAVVEVKNPFADIPLLPGLFVEAEIQGKELGQVNVLPRSSLFERDKIFILDDDNKIVSQHIKVLRKSDDFVWIQAAIPDNTLVTIEKQSVTPAGTAVDPVTVDSVAVHSVLESAEETTIEVSTIEE